MNRLSRTVTGLAQIAWIAAAASCADSSLSSLPLHGRERVLHQWHDDGGPGKISVRISLADQIAEFKRGDRDIGWCYVATGKEGHGTSAGTYHVMEKIEDKYSNRYGWIEDEAGNVTDGDASPGDHVPPGEHYVAAPMPYWMRITAGGIGMHGGLIPEPGKPASHGCIRMPKDFVPTLFNVVDVGTPVTITYSHSNRLLPEESQPGVSGSELVKSQWMKPSKLIKAEPVKAQKVMSVDRAPLFGSNRSLTKNPPGTNPDGFVQPLWRRIGFAYGWAGT